MARLSGYYDFNFSKKPKWKAVAFPDGDNTKVPDGTGIYRFVCEPPGEKQTLYTDTAPSIYGASLRACFCTHVLVRKDKNTELYDLYGMDKIGFEHCQCSEKVAKKHKHFLISNLNPFFNMDIKLDFGKNSNKNPFNN